MPLWCATGGTDKRTAGWTDEHQGGGIKGEQRERRSTGGSYDGGRQSLGMISGHRLLYDEVKSVGRSDPGGRRGGAERP